MYETQSKKSKSKRKNVKNSIGKSGGELSLSAKSNERSGQYISDLNTSLPEKFSYQNKMSNEDDDGQYDRKMRTIRKSSFSSSENLPTKAGEYNFDTGWSEVGFDRKKKEAVVSFQSNYRDENARSVQEDNKAKRMRISKGEEVLSNNMETGVVSMRTKKSENSKHVRRQWEEASRKKGHETTFDDVAPFHQDEEQKSKLKVLKDMNKTANAVDKTDIQKAITGLQTYINKKNMAKLNFENKFDSEFDKARKTFKWENDDYIFIMKKKRMLEEEDDSLGVAGTNLNNKNEDINKYILNSQFNNTEKSKLKLEMLKNFNLKNDKNLVSESMVSAPVKEVMASDSTEEETVHAHAKHNLNDFKDDFLNQNKSADTVEKSGNMGKKHGFLKSLMGIAHIIRKFK